MTTPPHCPFHEPCRASLARALLAGNAVRARDLTPARLHLAGKAAQLQRLRRWPADARGQVQALQAWAAGEVAR